jgi:hypothetical protein
MRGFVLHEKGDAGWAEAPDPTHLTTKEKDMSSTWTDEELSRIGGATELQVASRRTDGTLRPYVTIWGVRSGPDVYIRSAYGPQNGWFRRAAKSGSGRIRARGIERDVTFAQPDGGSPVHRDIDAAYHAKYDSYGPKIVGSVVGPAATAVTLQVLPR